MKNAIKNLKNFKFEIEFLILVISFVLILLVSILLIIIKFSIGTNWSYLYGFLLGYIFLLIGFIISVFSINLMIKYKSLFIFIFFFFIRMGFYSIPIILSSFFPNLINIFTVVSSLSLIWISAVFTNFLPIDKKNRKGMKKNE